LTQLRYVEAEKYFKQAAELAPLDKYRRRQALAFQLEELKANQAAIVEQATLDEEPLDLSRLNLIYALHVHLAAIGAGRRV
jgi:hypothetical protein